MRAPLVGLATILSMFAYSLLVFDDFSRHGRLEHPNWHILFLVFLVLTGHAVGFLVHRVRALSRFYGRRL
jgi:hypothetical protein